MKARANPAAGAAAAEVVSVRPALMRDRDAAVYLGRSSSWIRAARAADVKAHREGRKPSGPKWITIGPSVFYRVQDLDDWISGNAVERGVVHFANRGGAK